jgi:hypothetical protein
VLLRDGPCSDIAHHLRSHGVPFVIHSGYGRYSTEIDGFSDVPWLAKPCSPTELISMLDALSKSGAVGGGIPLRAPHGREFSELA